MSANPGRMAAVVGLVAAALACAACQAPLGLDLPSTRALESGAEASLSSSSSFEIAGTYVDSGAPWKIDMQVDRAGRAHMKVSQGTTQVEAILIGRDAYFRGRDFLSQHLTASAARTLANAAGNAWWKGSAEGLPQLGDFMDGARMRATFLGTVVTQRADHVSVAGLDAAELSGPRASVYVAEAPPNQLLRITITRGASVDGLTAGDFLYRNFNAAFGIAAPKDVIDFSNLSTLPPIYTVLSVDTSKCGSPCVVSALLKNLGGLTGASAPSTITFTMTASATGAVIGMCQATVVPDVGYNGATTVSCTIPGFDSRQVTAAIVTAVPTNPGRA